MRGALCSVCGVCAALRSRHANLLLHLFKLYVYVEVQIDFIQIRTCLNLQAAVHHVLHDLALDVVDDHHYCLGASSANRWRRHDVSWQSRRYPAASPLAQALRSGLCGKKP